MSRGSSSFLKGGYQQLSIITKKLIMALNGLMYLFLQLALGETA